MSAESRPSDGKLATTVAMSARGCRARSRPRRACGRGGPRAGAGRPMRTPVQGRRSRRPSPQRGSPRRRAPQAGRPTLAVVNASVRPVGVVSAPCSALRARSSSSCSLTASPRYSTTPAAGFARIGSRCSVCRGGARDPATQRLDHARPRPPRAVSGSSEPERHAVEARGGVLHPRWRVEQDRHAHQRLGAARAATRCRATRVVHVDHRHRRASRRARAAHLLPQPEGKNGSLYDQVSGSTMSIRGPLRGVGGGGAGRRRRPAPSTSPAATPTAMLRGTFGETGLSDVVAGSRS